MNTQENTQEKKKGSFLTLICTLLMAGILMGLGLYQYLKNSDLSAGSLLFKKNGITTIYYILLGLVPVLLLPLSYVESKKEHIQSGKEGFGNTIVCSFIGVFMVGTVVMQFLLRQVDPMYNLDATGGIFQKIALLFGAFGSLYFFIPAFLPKCRKKNLAWFGISALLWLMAELVVHHYYMGVFLISPTKMFTILSYALLIFFLVLDLRKNLDETVLEKPSFVYFALLAFLVTAADSFPRIFYALIEKKVTLDTFYVIARGFIGLYALFTVLPRLTNREKEEVFEELEENEESEEVEEVEEAEEVEALEEVEEAEEVEEISEPEAPEEVTEGEENLPTKAEKDENNEIEKEKNEIEKEEKEA